MQTTQWDLEPPTDFLLIVNNNCLGRVASEAQIRHILKTDMSSAEIVKYLLAHGTTEPSNRGDFYECEWVEPFVEGTLFIDSMGYHVIPTNAVDGVESLVPLLK